MSLRILKSKWQIIAVILSLVALALASLFYFFNKPFFNLPLQIVILVAGIPLLITILMDFFKGDWGADLLAFIALIMGFLLHQYVAAILIVLMLSGGQLLETYAQRKASSVLLALSKRMPNIVHCKTQGKITEVPLEKIKVGDEVVIYPHEASPVDGVVLEGNGTMDESYLTGEPYHISKAPGSTVLSGAINGESLLIIKAQKLPADSRYASIIGVLREAEQKRPQLRRLADQMGAIFAPIALGVAFAAWFFSGDIIRFLAVLMIATPCPLLIAIPITIISAISRAARHSIIIKDPTVLERLPTCSTAIFDKTGTLTYGKPTLTAIKTRAGMDADFILQRAASLERYSKHPLASAIVEAARVHKLALLDVAEVSEKPGEGLKGKIEAHTLQITGRKKIAAEFPELKAIDASLGLECIVLYDHTYAATFQFKDTPRQESRSFIHHLTPAHQFKKIMLVSGDRREEVRYLGNLLNIVEIYASQTPEEKLAIVRAEVKKAPTLFMGDGINDAPALTAATVGIAFGKNSAVTSEAAGAVIMENALSKVDGLLHLSIHTRNIALQSAIGGMGLSLLGMVLAACGWISPVLGALLQEIIDVLAILNALRLAWGDEIKTDF